MPVWRETRVVKYTAIDETCNLGCSRPDRAAYGEGSKGHRSVLVGTGLERIGLKGFLFVHSISPPQALDFTRGLTGRKGIGKIGKIEAMNQDDVIATLRRHETVLRAAGVVRLSVVGSTVRGEAWPESDVDLLAAFDDSQSLSLLDVVHIENMIGGFLGTRVDLVEEATLRPRAKPHVAAEAVRAS